MVAFSMPKRLALFMLLHYFSAGSWFVSLGVYMSKTLGFDAIVGAAYGMAGLSSMVSSLIAGMAADRYVHAQKLLGFMQLGAGLSLLLLSTITQSPTVFLGGMLLHYLFVGASAPLGVSIAFAHLRDPKQQLPAVRAAGTFGWILAGLTIGFWQGAALTAWPMRLGACVYLVSSLYAFTLPSTPPAARSSERPNLIGLFGFDILKGNRDRMLWIFITCIVLLAIPKKFYDSLLNNFLVEKGVSLNLFGLVLEPTGVLTLGQVIEALTLLTLPWVIARLGIKWVMVLGMAAWVLRFLLFAFGYVDRSGILWMILLGIFLQGLCYDFLFISAQIWFDQRFGPTRRTRAQSLFNFLLNGLGVIIGANVAGAFFHAMSGGAGQARNWLPIWLAPAALAMVLMVVFILSFKDRVAPTEGEPHAEPR